VVDPTKFVVRFERVDCKAQCSLCATPITVGVRAMLYPRGGGVIHRGYLLLCDECAEAIGEMSWDGEGAIELPVGGNCCVVEVAP
jgi:hypothetical protein